ncbi:cellulase N-terminal Ig-like domain-containing protein [Sphingomonas ginkgonis]
MIAGLTRRTALKSAVAALSCSVLPAACATKPAHPSTPRLNQLGFRPASTKHFVLATDTRDPLNASFVVETLSGRRVFEAPLRTALCDLTVTTGEHVRTGDFSRFNEPGCYRLCVGTRRSHPFEISEGVYVPLVRDAARAFHLIRANTAVDDPVTGLKFAAGHLSETTLQVDGRSHRSAVSHSPCDEEVPGSE